MVLDEQAQAVAGSSIAFGIARVEDIDEDTTFRCIVLAERCVEEEREAHLLHAFVELLFVHIERPLAESFRHQGTAIVDGIGHHVLEIGSVGYMHIDEEFRHPSVIELEPSTHFGCIGLHEVAVQVQVLSGVAGTQFFRSVLIDAVGSAEVLVSVYIEHRDEEEAHIVQEVEVLLLYNKVAEEDHARILTIGFAGMDTRFHQDDDTALLTDLYWVLEAILIDNYERQVASLRTGTERGDIHHR